MPAVQGPGRLWRRIQHKRQPPQPESTAHRASGIASAGTTFTSGGSRTLAHLPGPARLGGLLGGLDLLGDSLAASPPHPAASGPASGGKSSRAAFPGFGTAWACCAWLAGFSAAASALARLSAV